MNYDNEIIDDLPIPKGKSIAHHYFKHNRGIFCSFDIQTGDEFCGVIQVSAQIMCIPNMNLSTPSITKGAVFNEYIQP